MHAAWKSFTNAEEATVEKYKHLFPSNHNPNLPFVAFQQVVLREKTATATVEELNTLHEFIDTRFQEDTDRRERPWEVLRIDDSQSDVDLQRQYVEE